MTWTARVAWSLAIVAGLGAGTVWSQMTPEQAVQEARSVPRPDPRSIMTPGNAAITVPQYGADVSGQSSLFDGGRGALVPPGVTRVADCMARNDPECIAVQLVSTGRAARPSFTISPSDPLITGAADIRRRGDEIVGPAPGGMSPGFQTCTTTSQVTPATYVDETCEIVTPDSENTCVVTRDIQVDVDANYRCEVSGNRVQTYSCNKMLDVSVTWQTECRIDSMAQLTPDLGTMVSNAYCGADMQAHFSFAVAPGYECHAGLCNSDYYTLDIPLRSGQPATGSMYLARDYRCGAPCYITMNWSWDGIDRVVITERGDSGNWGAPTYQASGYLLPGICSAGGAYEVWQYWANCGDSSCSLFPLPGCYTPPGANNDCPPGWSLTNVVDSAGESVSRCYRAPDRYAAEFQVRGGQVSVPRVVDQWINNCAALEARQ